MSIIAYDLYDQKLWEVKQNGTKIGFVHVTEQSCIYKTKVSIEKFLTLHDLQKKYNFTLNKQILTPKKKPHIVYNFPSNTIPHNEIWDITKSLPLFTKSKKSKSYYCAGYYGIDTNNKIEFAFCPKKITIDRNKYFGPFTSKEALKLELSKLNLN